MISNQTQERVVCRNCLKSLVTCYCPQIRRFRTRLRLVVLQHPSEQRKAIGTARMAHLCIENSRLISGEDFRQNSEVNELIGNPDHLSIVLFPGQGSKNISTLSHPEIQDWVPEEKTLILFVIDGTWKFAKKMLRNSPNLLVLPQICFTPVRESEYQIRKQPHPQCVSTIEAIYQILKVLEPSTNPDNLMTVFRSMVEQQIYFSRIYQAIRLKAKLFDQYSDTYLSESVT